MKLRRPTKQVKLGVKYKREKKVRDKARKLRQHAKIAKKDGSYHKKLKKDPGIPNLFPFKKDMLKAIARKKVQMDTEHLERRNNPDQHTKTNKDTVIQDYATMVKQNAERTKGFSKIQVSAAEAQAGDRGDASRRAFYRELRKVVELADIVIQVLDARDPNSCRCPALEQEITDKGKRVIFVLNKIDLVPRESIVAWLAHLRRDFPTVAFKAAQTSKSGGADRPTHANTNALNATQGVLNSSFTVVGADTLLQLLKNYARIGEKKKALMVGIVGYPNVGKSSVINSLKRTAAVKVGGNAGVTRCAQEVQLDSKLTLIDSPGVVFAGNSSDPAVILRNASAPEALEDPVAVIGALLQKAPKQAIMRHFAVPDFQTPVGFLTQVAKLKGKLKKGGAANHDAAAVYVLNEWTSGKLRYYTNPPKTDGVIEENVNLANKAKVVGAYSKELDIDALFKDEDSAIAGSAMAGTSAMAMEAGAIPEDEDADGESDDDDMESGDDDDEDDDDEDESMDEDEESEEDQVEINEAPKLKGRAANRRVKGDLQSNEAFDFKTDFE